MKRIVLTYCFMLAVGIAAAAPGEGSDSPVVVMTDSISGAEEHAGNTVATTGEPTATIPASDTLSTTKTWTLNECLRYALENNIQLRQSRNNYLSGLEDTEEAKAAMLPSLTASTTQSFTNYPSTNVSTATPIREPMV